jgi:signal transduction histidine kinase/PAS domain-containing protein
MKNVEAMEIAKGLYCIAQVESENSISPYAYLLIDGDCAVLINPTEMSQCEVLLQKIEELTTTDSIHYVITHDLSPQICKKIAYLESHIEDFSIVIHSSKATFMRKQGLESSVYYIDKNSYELAIGKKRVLKFLTIQDTQSSGVFVTYDTQTNTLLCPDFFESENGYAKPYLDENSLQNIQKLHRQHLSTRCLLTNLFSSESGIDIETIVPKSGGWVLKKLIPVLIDKFRQDDCELCIWSVHKAELIKRQKELLEQNETYEEQLRHLKTIIDMQDNMIVVSFQKSIVECNEAFLDFFGKKSLDEFLENERCLCSRFVMTEDDRYISFANENNRCADYLVESLADESRVIIKDVHGRNITFKVRSKELDERKGHYHIVTFTDISDEAEQLDILQSLSYMDDFNYVVYDKKNERYEFSNGFARMFRLSDQRDESVEKQIRKYVSKKDFERLQESLDRKTDKFELTIHYDDKKIYLMAFCYQYHIGGTLRHIYLLTDISFLKRIELESKEKDMLMFQQSKLAQMGEMVGMIAHQWRQPINALSASSIKLSLMNSLGTVTSEAIDAHAEFVEEQTKKLSGIIDSFLTYSRHNAEDEYFYVMDVIGIIKEFVSEQYRAHDIEIIVGEDHFQQRIMGRKDMLEQVLLNLLANAKDALDEQVLEEQKYVKILFPFSNVILVEDNAGGVPDGQMDRLFTPYFTTKEQGKGTGIGLYMSKKIMKEHFKGDLTYEKAGRVSRFILEIGAVDGR